MSPRSEYGISLQYINLKYKGKSKVCGDQKLEQRLIDMLQRKVFICCKTLSNRIRIQTSAFKKQKPRTTYLVARGDHRKTINVIKVLSVKCTTVTGLTKEIVMAQKNRHLLVRHGDHC